MNLKKLNIACGEIFIEEDWVNLDFNPINNKVKKHNLLNHLSFKNETFDVIYTANFIEHIPLEKIDFFLSECYRVLKYKGKIRIVTPDFDEMCKSYISMSEINKKNFIKIQIIDQLVRKKSGGKMRSVIDYYKKNNDQDMINFINERIGHMEVAKQKVKIDFINRLLKKVYSLYVKFITFFLPNSFKNQNLSFANIGENHVWIWDFYELSEKLKEAKFNHIIKISFDKTEIKNFSTNYLDVNEFGKPRSGDESMYIEAEKS